MDLPAPFAPISPVIPGAKATVSPSRAVTPRGYCLVSAWVSMTLVPVTPGSPTALSMTRLSLTDPASQPGGRAVIGRESVLDVRPRA